MPATKKDKAGKKKQDKARGAGLAKAERAPQAVAAGDRATAAAEPRGDGASRSEAAAARETGGSKRTAIEPMRVKASEAARRIRGLADLSDSLDSRRRLRQLAQLVAHGSREVQGISFIEGLLGECLDDAAANPSPREQWLACEAATWGLAWLARTRRAGGSAGGLLERLVKLARTTRAGLHDRDTVAARFVIALARLFCDIEACRCLEGDAVAAIEEEIGRLVSADGAVSASASQPQGSSAIVERVVRWTAVRELAVATAAAPPWSEATEERWQAALVTALRLVGLHGRILTGAGRLPAPFSAPLLDAAAAAKKPAVRRTVAAIRKPPAKIDRAEARKLLPRDLHAADAAMAIVRTGWGSDSLRVLLDYRDATPRLEIAAGDRLLVDGAWQWSVTLGGRRLEAEGPWSLSCFESDRKATFLEIKAPLGGGLQIERQVVVLARDSIVLLADAVTHASAGQPLPMEPLRYEGTIVPAASLETERAEETRELVIYDTAMRFMALPLALPEWSAARATGGLEATAAGIVLRQEGAGRLYAPLWLDCDPSRQGGPLTWRQLTVADTRKNLSRHEAVGFRVQAGQEQWLLYRALDMPRNRTVLGCNMSCEFLLGRIRPRGMVARTLEIQ